jgi:hypothetical protein
MQENQILDLIDSLTFGTLPDEDKSIILAHVQNEMSGKRFASKLSSVVSEKIDEYDTGNFRVAQELPTYFQDFSGTESYPQPNEIINKSDIDKFLEKMSSKENNDKYFGDTYEFYHPTENMKADGVAMHRSDFAISQPQ